MSKTILKSQYEKTCSVKGCDTMCYCKNLCHKHYTFKRLYGDVNHKRKTAKKDYSQSLCLVEGCNILSTGNYCTKHKIEMNPVCRIDGCEKHIAARGLCWTHYKRQRRTGDPEKVLIDMNGHNEQHGMSGTKPHRKWCYILKTCKDDNIELYKPWSEKFSIFYKDIGDPPEGKPIFSRIDLNKGFFPDNCEWAKRQNAKNKKPVRCIETGVVYESISEAGRSLQINGSYISHVLCGKSKTSAGFHWEYVG